MLKIYDKNTDSRNNPIFMLDDWHYNANKGIRKHAMSKSTMLEEVEHNLKITNYHQNEGKDIDSHIMKCVWKLLVC